MNDSMTNNDKKEGEKGTINQLISTCAIQQRRQMDEIWMEVAKRNFKKVVSLWHNNPMLYHKIINNVHSHLYLVTFGISINVVPPCI